jgi:Amt family ammonium transporter
MRRLKQFREKDTRRIFGALLLSKMIGILAILGAMKAFGFFLDSPAGASTGAVGQDTAEIVNGLNTVWVLVTAFLVFFMQAGFMALEAGIARSKETVNIMMECVFDTCLCGILYWAFGFALQFGLGNAIVGHSYFFLHGIPKTYTFGGLGPDTGVAFLAFFLFQFAFADTASTITSGAMVGRTSFKGDIIYSTMVSGFIYPIFGHWAWGPGGWLQTLHTGAFSFVKDGVWFRDFAGSTVVHTVGGTIALWGAIVLGPRLGRKFKRDGGGPTPPHDLNLAALGAVMLWFGWYGFNPGSTLSGMDYEGIGRVAANTTLAAAAGGLIAVLFVYPRSKKWDLGMSLNGFLGGLVAITAPCYWVSPTSAVIIGAIAGVLTPLFVDFIEYLRVDDPIGAVAVHMGCGIWGTLAVGLFAAGDGKEGSGYGVNGLFFGGGADQLVAQLVGILACVVIVSIVSFVVFRIIRSFPGSWNLRIERELELEGIDIAEHGVSAYHMEIGQGMTYTTSSGLGATGLFGSSATHAPGSSVTTPTSPVMRPEPPSGG